MMVFELGETLTYIGKETALEPGRTAVFLTTSKEAKEILEATKMGHEGDIDVSAVAFCKMEAQQECLAGSLYIPRLLDVLGSRYKLLLFINKQYIVIVDDDEFAQRLIRRIQWRKSKQGETREKFLYNFITEFMKRDLELLSQYERKIMSIEEDVVHGKIRDFQNEFVPIRKELLTLRSYYDEIMDLGRDLEEDENGFFARKQLRYFGTISDRADRLMGRTSHLLEYAQQVKDAYQAEIDAKQNGNMQFLTVISTVFFPLTLVTGWYGMNFKNMPELEQGYPGVIGLSALIIIVIIVIFKRKKIF